MKFKSLESINLVNGAWYLVKSESLSLSGYVIVQAVRRMKPSKDGNIHYIIVLEKGDQRVDNMDVEGIIRLK